MNQSREVGKRKTEHLRVSTNDHKVPIKKESIKINIYMPEILVLINFCFTATAIFHHNIDEILFIR